MDRLSPGEITAARSRYLKSLLREARKGPDTWVLVDKNPSVTGLLHLFLRIFPELRVVITLRDPRDVG
jgi:hypothetical protein